MWGINTLPTHHSGHFPEELLSSSTSSKGGRGLVICCSCSPLLPNPTSSPFTEACRSQECSLINVLPTNPHSRVSLLGNPTCNSWCMRGASESKCRDEAEALLISLSLRTYHISRRGICGPHVAPWYRWRWNC